MSDHASNANPPNLSLVERADILAKAYAAIQMYFAHWQALPPDFDFEAVYHKALEAGMQAQTRFEFTLIMMELFAALQNGHSLYTDQAIQQSEAAQHLCFRVGYAEDQWFVASSDLAELPVGAVITHLNHQPIEVFFQTNRKYLSASCERAARQKFMTLRLLLPQQFPVRLEDGTLIEVRKQPISIPESKTTSRWLKKNKIGYIHIPSFDDSQFENDALQAVENFRNAKGLIIDVRGNGGGSTPDRLVKSLMDRPYQYWAESTGIHLGLFKANGVLLKLFGSQLQYEHRVFLESSQPFFQSNFMWSAALELPKDPLYTGTLVILIDSVVGSAAEDFVVTFKNNGRATLIGETTLGSTGQPYMAPFENGVWFRVSAKRAYFPNGMPFEGIGIAPDIPLAPTIADRKAGRDVVLERALETFKL
jgi:carboxyl-terminal processing protease